MDKVSLAQGVSPSGDVRLGYFEAVMTVLSCNFLHHFVHISPGNTFGARAQYVDVLSHGLPSASSYLPSAPPD